MASSPVTKLNNQGNSTRDVALPLATSAASGPQTRRFYQHLAMNHLADSSRTSVRAPANTILPRIAAGESSAVNDCLEAYGGLVWSIVRKYCGQKQEAEDVTQEIFIEIWQKVERFDPAKGSEANFVAMIARRRTIDRLRKKSASATEEVIELDRLTSDSPNVATNIELAEEASQAEQCLEKLHDDEQSVIRLAICDGLSHSRIAARLTMSLGTVKSHARRGLIKLRDCMKSHCFGISRS